MASSHGSGDVVPLVAPIVVMGVSGSGKTTVGLALAARLGAEFLDADDLHSPENRVKMASGHPLNDEDRLPWLHAVGRSMRDAASRGQRTIVACSALKRRYRDLLRTYVPDAPFVYLHGTPSLLESRLAGRTDHFMPRSLLASQLADLEPLTDDESGVTVDVAADVARIVDEIVDALASSRRR
jgi:carbohydrate kinase (thermoresistant glucokinase family)